MTKETLIRLLPFSTVNTRGSRQITVVFVLCVLLVVLFFLSAGIGAVRITPAETMAIVFQKFGLNLGSYNSQQETVLFAIRLPRVLLGVLVGAALATSGATMQGLFRNPLADPALLGVSTGCALGAVLFIVVGESFALSPQLRVWALPVFAFAGGVLTTTLVYRFGKTNGQTEIATMLLAGIAINAIAGAIIGLLSFMATDAQLRNITFWSLGSLGGATWNNLAATAPMLLASALLLPKLSRSLNALLLGEAEAGHLGINTEKLKSTAIILTSLSVGGAVAISGVIGFVGLIVPHLLRLLIGPDHRLLLPCSALFGASLLLLADLLSRTIVAPSELPVGIVTTFIGAPFFLWLLLCGKRNRS